MVKFINYSTDFSFLYAKINHKEGFDNLILANCKKSYY